MKAFYDHKPSKFEAVGNGSFIYRWNITEQEEATTTPAESEEEGNEQEATATEHWACDEVTVWLPVTAKKIVRSVISETWNSDHEQKLVNEFNAAQLGLYDEDTAAAKVAAYTAFLSERNALKASVEADCEELGIL